METHTCNVISFCKFPLFCLRAHHLSTLITVKEIHCCPEIWSDHKLQSTTISIPNQPFLWVQRYGTWLIKVLADE